jgi:signal transduction histidine kinase
MSSATLSPPEAAAEIEQLHRLIRSLREQNQVLLATNELLQESDRLKTDFFANMSHELRTPLNAIIGFSQVLLKGIDGPLEELQRTDLTAIYSSGQHLLALVNDILDLSKMEAGKMELFREWLTVDAVAAGVMTSAITLIDGKDIDLIEDIPCDLPKVYVDRVRIRQVMLNLVSNAAKFTDKGSIALRARQDRADRVLISVEDTGIGITPDETEIIFDHYRQADSHSRAQGTGLGLSISKKLVEMHGGQLWVNSAVGRGSTFLFTVPATRQMAS